MGDPLGIYDLNAVTCNFAALPIESGFGTGGAIKIERQEPAFTIVVGADGSIVRSKTNKKHIKVTIYLLQTSKANSILSTIQQIDEKAGNGAGVAPLLIRDRQGLFTIAGEHAWIEGPPMNVELGPEGTDREWVIWCADPERFDGGSS